MEELKQRFIDLVERCKQHYERIIGVPWTRYPVDLDEAQFQIWRWIADDVDLLNQAPMPLDEEALQGRLKSTLYFLQGLMSRDSAVRGTKDGSPSSSR